MEMRLADLADAGKLSARDIDIIVVATGSLSRAAVAAYMDARPVGPADLPTVAVEVADRICGCPYHDGGYTKLQEVDSQRVRLRVGGTCLSCPQILYTAGVLRSAILYRTGGSADVLIEGTERAREGTKPPNSQLTMAMLMRRTGLTFEDLDRELDRHQALDDEDLVRLARRCQIRREVTGGK